MTDEHRDPMDDLPSEEELVEAAALARALERETVDEAHFDGLLPALEAGHLLKMARAAEPSEARLAALYAELEASLPATPPASGRAAAPSRWQAVRAWLLVATSASVAAAVGLWFSAREAAAPGAVAALPAPTLAVLEAQLSAVPHAAVGAPAGEADGRARPLAEAMRPYRAELLARLATEYEP